MLNSFSIIEIESVEIDFLKIEIKPYCLNFSTLSARTTLLLQQIQANPKRPIRKSTNPLDQCRDCGSDVDSEPESESTGPGGIVFGMAWWFIYTGMVLPCPLHWSLQCGFRRVEVSMTKKKLGLVLFTMWVWVG